MQKVRRPPPMPIIVLPPDETEGQPFQVFIEAGSAFAGGALLPDWIPFLPKPGKYQHPLYGEINVTPSFNGQLVDSVRTHVYQDNIPLDAEHETKLSGAVAWIKDMRLNDDGSADAYVEWTDRGRTLVGGGQFKYISPEWFSEWKDPATGVVHRNVVAGGAITTRPFFKEKVLRALVASEQGAEMLAAEDPKEDPSSKETFADMAKQRKCTECSTEFAETATTCPKCGAKFSEEGAGTTAGVLATLTLGPATYTAAEVDGKIQAATASFAEQLASMTTELEAAKAIAASEKTAREALGAELGQIKATNRHARFVELVAGRGGANDGGPWAGDADKHVTFLEKLAEQFGDDGDVLVNYVEQQTAIAQQLAQADAFREIGSSAGRGSTDPEKKLDTLAKSHQAANPSLSFAEAYTQVLSTPEGARLYEQV
jgi:hypothetical protein